MDGSVKSLVRQYANSRQTGSGDNVGVTSIQFPRHSREEVIDAALICLLKALSKSSDFFTASILRATMP